jgi:putative aldouronate transport system permease protein
MATRRKVRRTGAGDFIYHLVVYGGLTLFSVLCLIPIVHVIAVSIAPRTEVLSRGMMLWPKEVTWGAYQTLFRSSVVMRGFLNSLIITVGGTTINLILTSTFSYGLAKTKMPGSRALNFLVVVSMLFPAGIIPLYLVMNTLGLLNTYLVLMLVLAINPFYCILMRNFFENVPADMFDSAYMEGASEGRIYLRIALPLSKAAIAAFTLFYAVFHWNSFFFALVFISDQELLPIQVHLRNLIDSTSGSGYAQGFSSDIGLSQVTSLSLRMAVVVAVMVPILLLYPFLQKHFAKGVMLGSVKG